MPEYTAKGVAIVGVSNDAADANGKFASECGFTYPLLCDTDLKVSMAYGAASSPTAGMASRIAVLIDAAGKIEQYHAKVDARAFPTTLLESI